FAGAGTSSWWRCSIRRRYPWGALSQSPGRPSRRWRHTLRSCRPQKGRWPPKTSGGRSDRAMREGTNMGIMTTLKKPTAESVHLPRGGVLGAGHSPHAHQSMLQHGELVRIIPRFIEQAIDYGRRNLPPKDPGGFLNGGA